jgi:putative ABC transport system permease protein
MQMVRKFAAGIRALFKKRQGDAELDEELRDFVEQSAAAKLRTGMTGKEALRAARMEMGGVESVKENVRAAGWETAFNSFWRDVRFAIRLLRKTPLITSIALFSLALGIGANTAIFSLIDAVMLRMLPVPNPEQLALIKFRSPVADHLRQSATNPLWEQVRDHQDAFSGVIAWSPETFDLADGGEVNDVHGIYASGSYFTMLGVRPAAGRLMVASDDVRNCGRVAVLSYGFWQARYAGAQSAIGSTIRLNGYSFPIVGVAQQGFFGTEIGVPLDVAIPICAEGILDGSNSMLDERSAWWLQMMGRLKPGVSVEQADARMKVIAPELFDAVVPQDYNAKQAALFRSNEFFVLPGDTGTGGIYSLRERYRQPLEILMFVVGLVLLIACANIASLLLARSAARQKEIAVRLSLGASRGRLIRQVLTESVVLSGAGAILGIFFAQWGSALMVRLVSTQTSQVFLDLQMDGRVLGFTIAVTVMCGLLFGILPALRGTRVDAMSAMKEGQAQASGGRSHSSAVRWIVGAQVALSLILLIGTGLFVRTFANLMTLNAGFDVNNVLMVQTNVHNAGLPEAALAPLYGQMLAKLEAIPGVVSASQCWMTPLSGGGWDQDVSVPGYQAPEGVEPLVDLNWVTPAFFRTMRTPLLEGRAFDSRDTATSTPVIVINQLLAETYFPKQNPIGKHLVFASGRMFGAAPLEIVGVVQNAKYLSLGEDFTATAYIPLAQAGYVAEKTAFEIRTGMTPGALIPAVRDAMGGVNKLASLQFVTLKQEAEDSVTQEHLLAVLSGFFGGLALLLTAIGLYGVMAYVVTQRTHEIGIRMALGARQGSILRLVMRDAAIVVAAGVAVGLLGSIWIMRLVKGLLFGLTPNDPWTTALAILAMTAAALVATYVPARRAMGVDPMVALRYE